MTAKEIRDLSNEGLVEQIRTSRKELFGLRFQHATGELDNTSSLRQARREVARALTIAKERGIEVNG